MEFNSLEKHVTYRICNMQSQAGLCRFDWGGHPQNVKALKKFLLRAVEATPMREKVPQTKEL